MNKNNVTIITGGGRGIGRAIALRMALESPVMLAGRTRKDLAAVCKEIENSGGTANFCVGDVTDPTTAKRCLAAIVRKGLTVRHLVTNAGIGKGGSTENFAPELFAEIMAVNVNGTYNFVHACLPPMLKSKAGTIVMVSSILGVRGHKREAAYTASKHALVGLTRSLAHEYAASGIVVVALCPSFVESDMTQRTINGLMRHRGMSGKQATAVVAGTNPQKRIIPASEVAEMAAFVCSGRCPSVNGTALVMGGGSPGN